MDLKSFFNILSEIIYILCGLVSISTAFRGLKNEKAKIGTFLFWFILGVIFILENAVPYEVTGALLIILGLITVTNQLQIGNFAVITHEFKIAQSQKLKNKIFIPALLIGVSAFLILQFKIGKVTVPSAVGIGGGAIISLIVASIILKPKLKETNDLFVMNSPLKYGFTHAEYKYENGVFYLIEIGARGGGNMISSIITQYMSGYDTYKYLIDCSLGNVFDTEFLIDSEHKDKAAVLKFFSTPQGGGEVIAIEGLDYLDTEPDIRAYKFNFKIGDEIIDAKNDSARIGFYVACSENLEKLKNVMKVVEDKVKIRVK